MQFHKYLRSKTLSFEEMKSFFTDDALMDREGLKG